MSAAAAARGESTLARIAEALEGTEYETSIARDGMACVRVSRDAATGLFSALREAAGFESVTLVTAVDRLPAEPRFEVTYQLWSLSAGDRLRVQVEAPGDDPVVPSCTHLWPGAAFFERECFDMFGVTFEGHAGLKRLLMPEGYEHHPLRKDFPHQGIEPDKLYRRWDEERRRSWEERG